MWYSVVCALCDDIEDILKTFHLLPLDERNWSKKGG